MLLIMAWIVWIAIWGVLGYASFKTIKSRIEQKRMVDGMVNYWVKQAELQRNYNQAIYNAIKSAEKND